MARKTNPLIKARKAYEDAIEAGIHVDIGSHNTRAKNPARRKVARKSSVRQLFPKALPKKPLFPKASPKKPSVKEATRKEIFKEYQLCVSSAMKEKDELNKVAVVNYGAGLLRAAFLSGLFSFEEIHSMREGLKRV